MRYQSSISLLLISFAGVIATSMDCYAAPMQAKRIARPLTAEIRQVRIHPEASINGAAVNQTAPSQKVLNGATSGTTSELGGQESFVWPEPLKSKFGSYNTQVDAKPESPAAETKPYTASTPTTTTADPPTDYALPTVIVRMTGYMEDTSIVPRINTDAIAMANEFLQTGKKSVIILLERTSVKLAAGSCSEMSVNGNLVDFRKLLRQFIGANGRVVLNKKWADEFGVQRCDLIPGPQIMRVEEVADLIAEAEKIVDYATPNYPYNLQILGGAARPDPSTYK